MLFKILEVDIMKMMNPIDVKDEISLYRMMIDHYPIAMWVLLGLMGGY